MRMDKFFNYDFETTFYSYITFINKMKVEHIKSYEQINRILSLKCLNNTLHE